MNRFVVRLGIGGVALLATIASGCGEEDAAPLPQILGISAATNQSDKPGVVEVELHAYAALHAISDELSVP